MGSQDRTAAVRWLTLPEVAEHMLEQPLQTVYTARDRGDLDGIVTKRVGSQLRYHPESAWHYACTGQAAASLDEAYAWAEKHPLPPIPRRGARLVDE